jgi:hypothetical protein
MRAIRALFLTLMVAVLTIGLLCLQFAAILRLTLLSPSFVVGALERVGFYDVAVDAALAAAAPPPGSSNYESAMIIIEAAREALEPEPVLQILYEALSQAMQVLTDPTAPRRITVDLRPVRDAFIASLLQAGQEHQATSKQIKGIESELRRMIPDTMDLVSQFGLDAAQLEGLARFYAQASRAALIFVGALVLLSVLVALVARRAWRSWLAAALLVSGLAVLASALFAAVRAPHLLAKTVDLSRVLPPSVEASTVTEFVLGFGRAVLLVAGAVGLVVAAAGCVLAWLGRKTARPSARQVQPS